MAITRAQKKAEDFTSPTSPNQSPSPNHGCSGSPLPPEASNQDAPSSTPAMSTSNTGRMGKGRGAIPKIVMTAPKTNLRIKRRSSNCPEDVVDSAPYQLSTKAKRARLSAPKLSKAKTKAVNNDTFTSYPNPVSAQFPPIPKTAAQQSLPAQRAVVQISGRPQKPNKPFSLLAAFLQHPELCLHLARTLEVPSLIDLYCISKPFHFILNSHYTTYVRASMENWSPHSNYIFPWRCYTRLCIKDPGFRPTPSVPTRPRDVPSLKWLQMVAYRHKVICEILLNLADAGLLLPAPIVDTLKKLWFTMDLPSNGNRIGVVHNEGYWLDQDLFYASMFFMKVDMRFTDPVEGTGELHLRKLLLGMRNLVPLRDLLYGELRVIHLLQRQAWYCYTPSEKNRTQRILGLAPDLVGKGNTENWGRGAQRLIRVDECIMREGVRRSLNMHYHYMDMMLFGHLEQSQLLPKSRMTKLKDLPWEPLSAGKKRRLAPFMMYRYVLPSMENMAAIPQQ